MLHHVIKQMEANGYELFTRPFELNIVGIRNDNYDSQKFNDELYVFFRSRSVTDSSYDGWSYYCFPICTDPVSYDYYERPDRYWEGLLIQGQYINGFTRVSDVQGIHGDVLLQQPRFPIRVFYDRIEGIINSTDLRNPRHFKPLAGGRLINIYYDICFQLPVERDSVKWIDQRSGGCQVFENAEDFELFMMMCSEHENRYGNNFTYTLIDQKDPAQSAKVRLDTFPLPGRATQCPPDQPTN